MRLPPASYDFSALYLPGTYPNTPRELFMDVFYPKGLVYSDGTGVFNIDYEILFEDLATQYKGIEIRDSRDDGLPDSNLYLNKHLYTNHESSRLDYLVNYELSEEKLERNLNYAPFFLTFWEGQPMIGYVWKENNKPVFAVGYLDENEWVYRPSIPRGILQQNEGKGWYSDRFILFPLRSNYGVLNYPKGI